MITEERKILDEMNTEMDQIVKDVRSRVSPESFDENHNEIKAEIAQGDNGYFDYPGWKPGDDVDAKGSLFDYPDMDAKNLNPEAAKGDSYDAPGSPAGALRPEDYVFVKPEMPAGMTWDVKLETWFRQQMAAEGKSQAEAQDIFDSYSKGKIQTFIEADDSNADTDADAGAAAEQKTETEGGFFDYDMDNAPQVAESEGAPV